MSLELSADRPRRLNECEWKITMRDKGQRDDIDRERERKGGREEGGRSQYYEDLYRDYLVTERCG